MKNHTPLFFAIFMLFFAICLTGVPTEAKTVWNSQTIKVKKGGFTFYAKKSQNGRKSWIYRVKTTSKKSVPKALNFPKKIKGAKLTRLGYEKPVYEESEFSKNIFNSYVEEAHNAPGTAPKIKKMTIPDSVTTIEYDAFSGMYALKSVTLPKSLKKLEPSVFFGCEKLKSITLSRKMQSFTPYAFGNCSSLKKVSVPGKNKYYYTRKGMLISKTENKLVWIAPGLTEAVIPDNINTIGEGCLYGSALTDLTIPASVTKIEQEALMSSWLTNIDLKDGNPVYGKDGQCIYQKSNGALVVGIVENDKLVISDKVTEISQDAMTAGDGYIINDGSNLRVLDIPASVRALRGMWSSFCHMSTGNDVYFRGLTPPVIDNPYDPDYYSGIPVFQNLYVPASALETYKKWVADKGCERYCTIKTFS